MNSALTRNIFIALLIAAQTSCTYGTWELPEMHPRIVDGLPSRSRFTYERPTFNTKVIASQITIAVEETRDGLFSETKEMPVLGIPEEGETIKVALHRSFIKEVQERVDQFITGQGLDLELTVVVRAISATQISDIYKLDGACDLRLAFVGQKPFMTAEVREQLKITAPPYDASELDEMHRAIGLRFIDKLFASDQNIYKINFRIKTELTRPPEGNQYI